MDVSTACDDIMQSPVPSIAFEIEVCQPHASSPSIPKRVHRRLLDIVEHRSRSPSSLQEIEVKLKEAESRRQQFHEWLANKAKPKTKTHLHSPQTESPGHRLHTKLLAAEQKRLDLLAQEQTRLARSHELRAAARIEVQLRAEREREELESRVESRVHQAETNRLALQAAEKQKRAAAHERVAQSIVQRTSQEGKDRERIAALRALICQRIAAAEEKRESRLKAKRTRAQAAVLQARRVAKAVSRKRELESRKKKERMEARLQGAKKRRADYLGQRGCQNKSHKMRKHGERLCRKLARCWRRFQHSRQTTLKLALDFSACSINQQGVISLPFEEVAARITSPLSLGSVRALLIRLENRFFLSSASRSNIAQIDHLLKRLCPVSRKSRGSAKRISRRNHTQESSEACIKNTNTKEDSYSPGMRNGDSSHSKEEKRLDRYPVRVFLCAYMILGHPDAVFSAQGEREDALSKAALKLVVEFEALVSTIVNGPGSTCLTRPSTPNFTSEAKTNSDTTTRSFAVQLAEFDAAWGSYLYQFVAWKAEDAQLLEDDLIKVACQLEFSMLQKCWSCNTAGVEASSDSQAIQQQVLEDHQLLRERVLHLTGSTGLARMQQALSQTRTHFLKERERGSLHSLSFASPQEPHMGTDMTRARTLDNEQMVNEILHEPNFPDGFSRGSTVPCKFSGIQAQIKATMEGAFWNLVMEGLAKDPPCYESIIELLKEVKMELESIAPGSWKQEIHECLDIQIFCQVLESGCQDYAYLQRLLDYAFGIISKLSAPARDSDARRSLDILLQELSQISTEKEDKIHSSFGVALVKGLRFVLEQLQILKADISAARIQALEPIIQGSAGIDYMRRLFAERFKLPEATASHLADSVRAKLPKTLAWLGGVQQTLERERNDLESLRSAYWSTLSETEACIPPISSMRTGARMVLVKPSSSTVKPSTSSPGFEHKTVPWNSMQTLVGLGLVHIICDAQAITEDTIAETLRLNLHRLRKAQNDFQHLILMSTGLLTLRQSCTPEGLNGVQLESLLGSCKTELETLLKDPGVTISQIGLLLSKFSTDGHKEESELKLATNADLLSCVLNRSLAPEDMVFIRVSVALQTSLRAIILLGQGAEGLAVVNLALQRIGVTCLQETIIDLGNLMRRVMSVTCSVHESWYACMFTAAS